MIPRMKKLSSSMKQVAETRNSSEAAEAFIITTPQWAKVTSL